jgi:hypothetical protein
MFLVSDVNKKLWKALEQGDIDKIKKYLGKGASINSLNNVSFV